MNQISAEVVMAIGFGVLVASFGFTLFYLLMSGRELKKLDDSDRESIRSTLLDKEVLNSALLAGLALVFLIVSMGRFIYRLFEFLTL